MKQKHLVLLLLVFSLQCFAQENEKTKKINEYVNVLEAYIDNPVEKFKI